MWFLNSLSGVLEKANAVCHSWDENGKFEEGFRNIRGGVFIELLLLQSIDIRKKSHTWKNLSNFA